MEQVGRYASEEDELYFVLNVDPTVRAHFSLFAPIRAMADESFRHVREHVPNQIQTVDRASLGT